MAGADPGTGGSDGAATGESVPAAFPVTDSLAGERLDRAVALLTGWSRAEVQALVRAGAVLVDGSTAAKSHRLAAGETVTVTAAPEPQRPPGPEPLEFEVRHEDRWLLVVDKPAGLVVHPGAGNEGGTLVNGLLARYPELAEAGDPMRPGIVHRLDKGTSGLLVVAGAPEAHERLVGLMAQRRVERRYRALVWGRPEPPAGAVEAPVGRSTRRRTRMAVTPRGREARTVYEVVEAFAEVPVALLDVGLDTGRTHQIRVHLAAIGHPVVGDAAYGRDRRSLRLDRPFLHAHRISFEHPFTGGAVAVEEPLPEELESVLVGLRGGSEPR